jgi:exocyst complex component 5
LICHLWQHYVNTALLPLASSSVTTRREMVVFNNQAVSRLEAGVNELITRAAASESHLFHPYPGLYRFIVVMAWLSQQLAKQKRNDFKPRDEDISFARVNTDPCTACCDMLDKVREAVKPNLSGKNQEIFFTEIGIAFHTYVLFLYPNST